MNRRLLPAIVCAFTVLALSGCGGDPDTIAVPDADVPATPTSTATILDLPEPSESEDATEEEDPALDPAVSSAQVTAQKIITKLTKKVDWGKAKTEFSVGAKEGRKALDALPFQLDRSHRMAYMVVTSGYATFCVENIDGLAYASATVTETDETMAVAEGSCPEAEVAKVIFDRDQAVEAAEAEKDRKAAAEREKKADKKAEEKADEEAAEADAEALLDSVAEDAEFVAGLLTGKVTPPVPGTKPGKNDVRNVDTIAEVNAVLSANGSELTDGNTVGSVAFTGKGFTICVQSSPEGPSAIHNATTDQTDVTADSSC